MSITAQQVQDLRAKTGAGIMDCKKALQESTGDLEKAIEYLRKKGLSAAAKKAHRVASEGLVSSYIHGGGKIGVLVEVNCETDFVARGADFQQFVKDMAMQVAATNPRYVRREDVPEEEIEKERTILTAQVQEQGKNKPAEIVQKMVDGRLDKLFFKEICLLEQAFVKEPKQSVADYLNEMVAKIGEKIEVRRFVRFELGEGLEKRKDDFASEVAAAVSA